MKKLILVALAAAAAVAAEEPASAPAGENATFRGDARHSGVYPGAAVEGPVKVRWSFATGGPVRSSPAVTRDSVYVGSGDGHLYALDRATGEERWKLATGGAVDGSPAVAAGSVYVTSRDRSLYAVDAATGKLRWRFPTGEDLPHPWGWDYFLSSPLVVGGTVYAGSRDGHLYAIDAVDGRELWRFETGGRVSSSPAAADGVVYFGSMDGHLYAVDAASGELRWKLATDGAGLDSGSFGYDRTAVTSSPAVAGDTVLVGGRDAYLYAVDRATGAERWRFDHKLSWVISSPAIDAGLVLCGSSDGLFFQGVDLATGAERWRFKTKSYVHSSGSVAGGVVYFGCQDRFLYALDAATGEERWRFRSGGGILSTPAVGGGALYFGDDQGTVYALAGSGTPRRPLERVVHYQEYEAWKWFGEDRRVRDFFAAEGYTVLDGAGLAEMMEQRIADGEPSVVVFAVDRVPRELGTEPAKDGLLRRYLAAGGKVVWMGIAPFTVTFDPETGKPKAFDMGRPQKLLDVGFADDRGDVFGTTLTADGRRWGLEDWWPATGGADPAEVSTVLAENSLGRAAAWVKSFGGGEGTGFVYLGSAKDLPFDLAVVRALAEYRGR